MTTITNAVFAVTGAGSGIGRALAQQLVARGAHVALSDINAQALDETAATLQSSGKVTTHVVDVRNREAVERYAADVKSQHGGCDAVINNAGLTVRASLEEVSYEDFELVIGVNLWGVIYGTKAFLPMFRERGAGHIVNISSINAFVPFAKNGPYNISKYAVHGLNETLMQELAGTGIHVTSVHPGGIRTNIANNAKHMKPEEAKAFGKIARTSADEAARVILRAVERNRERVYVGLDAKIMAAAKRIIPALTVRAAGAASDEKFVRLGRRLGR